MCLVGGGGGGGRGELLPFNRERMTPSLWFCGQFFLIIILQDNKRDKQEVKEAEWRDAKVSYVIKCV